MKKEDITGLLVYLVIFAFAIVFGLTVLREFASKSSLGGLFFLFVLGAIVVGIILNAIIFEMGHLLGAKIGHYDVLSVNILGFCFYKENNKIKFKFKGYDGLTGETRIYPRKDNSKHNPRPYLLLGTLFFAIEFVAFVILFSALKSSKSTTVQNVAYFLLIVAVLGAMIEIYNILPLQLDTITDGYRLKLISNPKNKEAFDELLRVKYAIENGEKDVQIKTFENITNFTSELNLNKVYALLDKGNWEEAEKLLDQIIDAKDGVSYKVYLRSKAQKIYINLMFKSEDDIKEFYETQVPVSERRQISEDVSMASIRAYMLMSGLLDKSRSETELALNNVMKAFKRTSKQRQPIELKLYNDALNKVIAAHNDWHLEVFLLEEVKKEEKDNK